MNFVKTELPGAYIIEIEKILDDRGFFARTLDLEKNEELGIESNIVQSSISYNVKKGTLRGMHFQIKPFEEAKFVRCTKGKIFDVIIDLRENSSTFQKWISVELSDENHRILYVPKGFAHGFQTLVDNTEVFYEITQVFNPEYARGLRYDNKEIGIEWPLNVSVISEKDANYD
ncbi:dTDP-4-dehydrorhamnose 3,5-epimerase [Nitrosopumilus sp.]|uniref:dTDP-4-dehydrorhamnose 3,5-epimerase n=1 Tax=Nitrosopumilus sp. TaxID=2024843 RepID=UPI00262ABFC4|nr:dTDP-4-dehydrorhamnose 3,5-epimerase [Nitrosopumilus sp.]